MNILPSKRLLIIGFSLALLSLVAAAVFFFGKNLITEAWSAYTLPEELRSATFITTKNSEQIGNKVHSFRYLKIPYPVGNVGMFSSDEDEVLAVRQIDQSYLLEFNGVELVRNLLPVAAPSQSPNSKVILFSQAIAEEKKSDIEVLKGISAVNPSNYEIRILAPASVKNERVISGYAPLFVTDTRFLFFAYSGLYQYDIQSGVGKMLLEKNLPVIFGPVLQSPDRSLIAFADVSKNTTYVYRVKESELVLVLETPTVLIKPALSNTALYEMKGEVHGSEIWKYDFVTSEAQLIHTIPRSLGLSRIVF